MSTTIKFDRLPGGRRLFMDYLYDPCHVGAFFAWPFRSDREFESCVRLVDDYRINRTAIVSILKRQNQDYKAHNTTLKNIERLLDPRALTIFTGQQVGATVAFWPGKHILGAEADSVWWPARTSNP